MPVLLKYAILGLWLLISFAIGAGTFVAGRRVNPGMVQRRPPLSPWWPLSGIVWAMIGVMLLCGLTPYN
jgi:hypothetical protein